MIEDVIFDTLCIDDDYEKDLKYIFKLLKKLDNKLILAINIFTTYILQKRRVI